MAGLIHEASSRFLNLLYPRNCIFCNLKGVNVCDKCFQTKFNRYEQVCHVCGQRVYKRGLFVHTDCQKLSKLEGIFSCYRYNKHAKQVLKLIKYDGYHDLVADVVRSMATAFPNLPIGYDFLVPIPIHKKRFEKRGFNQAELIAKGLTWNYQDILLRTKNTTAQAELDKEQRMFNVQDAFSIGPSTKVKGKTILLIDDVFTTGATLENCAEILKKAGAVRVFAFTWARD